MVPVARCQVAPPSTDTSTAASRPPASDAVPVTVTSPETELPAAGEVIALTGATESDDAVAATSPDCMEPGCVPMSANRLRVACCILTSATEVPSRWSPPSSPQDQRTVPEAKTSAPLGRRCSVALCVAVATP